jgi:UDP-3-O-[3-hydroxymyristoyl] glucosamine N-acyltransferase
MTRTGGGITAGQLARAVKGRLRGDPERVLTGIRSLEEAGEADLSFLANPRYLGQARHSRAGVIVCAGGALEGRDRIEVDHPHLALAAAIGLLHPAAAPPTGIDPRAAVGRDCRLGEGVSLGAHAVVGDRCRLGDRVVLHPGVVLGADVTLGDDCVLHPTVVVYPGCSLGSRVVVHAGTVIGSDGFGYATLEGTHHKIPHVGTVVVEDDVEIGAGATVDRATLGRTLIGAGTKIDNLVMVAHNVEIGPGSLLVAQSGVAGSTRLGRGVVLAGQSGAAGHLRLGDGSQVAAKSAVLQDLADGATVAGTPAIPLRAWRRAQAAFARLPEMLRRLRRLEGGGDGSEEP